MITQNMIDKWLGRTEGPGAFEKPIVGPAIKPRLFSDEFKTEVLTAIDAGLPVKEAARTFEVSVPSIYNWKRSVREKVEAARLAEAEANKPRGDLFRRILICHSLEDGETVDEICAEYEYPREFVEEVSRERDAGRYTGAALAYAEWWSPRTGSAWITDELAVIIQNPDGSEVTDPRILKRLGRQLMRVAEMMMAEKRIHDDPAIVLEIELKDTPGVPSKGYY
jgi:hypothetical protein